MKTRDTEVIKIYTPEETAEILTKAFQMKKPLSVRTLANWRSFRKGPKPTKSGRAIGYTLESINAYIRLQTGFEGGRAA